MTEQRQQAVTQHLNRRSWTHVKVRLGILLIAIFCGLTLSGCDFFDTVADLLRINGSDVEAQEDSEMRIETLTIQADSFSITVDDDTNPTPEVMVLEGGVIEFKMLSEATVRFASSGSSTSEVLETNDIVLLQSFGTTSVMTFIRVD